MCFPVLFPDGNFGKYHPREVKVSDSEYVKSHLLNKDSCFRKDPPYVFFLLRHKEMREIACVMYNLLNRFDAVSAYMRKMDHYGLSDFLKISHTR